MRQQESAESGTKPENYLSGGAERETSLEWKVIGFSIKKQLISLLRVFNKYKA